MTQLAHKSIPKKQESPPGVPVPPPQWDDAPLSNKIILLIVLAAAGGALAAFVEGQIGHLFWPFALMISAVIGGVICLAHQWVINPYRRLVRRMARVRIRRRVSELKHLPTHRNDEIGLLARQMYDMALSAFEHSRENRRLRRTVDDRIKKAVRRAVNELESIAMRDPMTDLGNRRFLDEHMNGLARSVRESGDDLVCLAIDLDNFKQVNDQLGHAAGDNLLTFVADLIRGSIRREDCAVRLGGDEFAIFLPACSIQRAGALAKQLIALFKQCTRATMPENIGCGMSIGLSSLQRDLVARGKWQTPAVQATPAEALIDAADEHLYAVKRQGKGCVAGI